MFKHDWLLIYYLKGLGEARRIDDAFQLLESVEQGTAVGSPELSAPLVCSLLNALVDAGQSYRSMQKFTVLWDFFCLKSLKCCSS